MQSAAITTTDSISTIIAPHEYLRDTVSIKYQECKSCENRTQLVCIKCGYCYSCHWKEEEREKERKKIQFKLFLSEQNDNSSNSTTIVGRGKILQQQSSDQANMIIDVFGQKIEPICNYYRCYHKFSLHGSRTHVSCHCKHPVNSIIGVSKNVHER
jgi:hypothetical protein